MTGDFDLVRGAFATSIIGRGTAACAARVRAAWATSATGRTARRLRDQTHSHAPSAVIRKAAVAIAIASIAQPGLIAAMSRTVAPAMPAAVFVLMSVFAIAVAWQAEAIARAWPASCLARWTRR